MIQKEIFSERLKAAMKKQNLKQIDLVRAAQAQGIKLGKSHVSQYVSGKTVPRTDILLFLAKTLQVEEEWLIGVSDIESDTEVSTTKNRTRSDTNKTISENSNQENSESLTLSIKKPISETKMISNTNHNIQTTSAATISRNTSNKEGKKMREFKKSSKLDNVLYDVRGPVVDEATRMEEAGTHVLKLNIGNPAPFGFRTPDEVIYDMRQQLTDCEGYSNAMGLFSARKAIMQYAQLKHIPNVNINDIYTGNGVSELINLCMSALLDNGDEILIPSPDYPLWTACATLAGGKPVHYICDEESEWYPDIDDIRKKINDRTKAIVIINPNNPTGALYPKEVLEQIVQVAREHQLIIFSDEIYDRLVMDGEKHISIASLAPDLFCVTFSGLSKSHMIAGFRVGWMILSGNKAVAKDYIEGLNMLSNMRLCSNVPGQSIVQTALGGHQSVEDYIMPGGRIYEQREFIYKALTDIPGISAVKPKAAFYIFPKIDTKKFNIVNDEQFVLDLLREKKVLLIHGGGFNWQQPDHFRVVYLPRIEVLKKATDSMADFLNHYRQ
nr:aminotransferase class I/II-fold pyridoxal phosphate-dependent enzyme [uncultured Anaerobutyricum sp.]